MKLKSLFSLLLSSILLLSPLQASAYDGNSSTPKVGDITPYGVVTAVDENGYFFSIDETTSIESRDSINVWMTGTFDTETILDDKTFYLGGYAVCENFANSAGPVQFKLGDKAVGVPPGSGYSFTNVWGKKILTVAAIEVWGQRTVTWNTVI